MEWLAIEGGGFSVTGSIQVETRQLFARGIGAMGVGKSKKLKHESWKWIKQPLKVFRAQEP